MLRIALPVVLTIALIGCNKSTPEPKAASSGDATQPVAPASPNKDAKNSASRTEPEKKEVVWDGPLGIKKGLSLSELQRVLTMEKLDNGGYSSKSAPAPHTSFEQYVYLVGEKSGLCGITAISKTIESNQAGDQLRNSMSSIEEALSEKYGKPTVEFKYLPHSSIWKEDKYWMMSLLKKDRKYEAAWYSKEFMGTVKLKGGAAANLPSGIDAISVEAKAIDTEKAYYTLTYSFDNNDDCVEEIRKEKNKTL